MIINGSGRTARGLVRRPALANPLPFLRGWSRDPVAVGWPFASSYWTARRLAQAALDAAVPGSGPVLELGAGTGPVTEALIETGCPVDQLVVVEREPQSSAGRWKGAFAASRCFTEMPWTSVRSWRARGSRPSESC